MDAPLTTSTILSKPFLFAIEFLFEICCRAREFDDLD